MDRGKQLHREAQGNLSLSIPDESQELQAILDRAKALLRNRPEYRFEEEKNLGLHEYERGQIDHESRIFTDLLDQ